MMSRREYIVLFIAFVTLIHASHADTLHAEERVVSSEEEHESIDSSSSEESVSPSNTGAAEVSNPAVNPVQLAEDNKKASEELKEITTKLEAIRKDLDKAIKAKDAKKITALKKEYSDKKDEYKNKLNDMANELEDRELPDGRVLPFSESGKKLQEELVKTAKLQKKINDMLKPMSDEALAKMQKDQDDLAKDKLVGATAVGAATTLGNIIAPGLGPLAGLATQAAIDTHSKLTAPEKDKPAVEENKPVSTGSHVTSKTEVDVPTKVDASRRSEMDELASLQSVNDKAKAKEKEKIADIAEKLLRTQERLHEFIDEGGMTDTGPDTAEIWGLLQLEFKSSIDELLKISNANQGKPYAAELNKDIQNAINAVSKTTKLLATVPPRNNFSPSMEISPEDSIPENDSSANSPGRITQTQPDPGSFASTANEISNSLNRLQKQPEPPPEESWADWALRKAGEAYDTATNTISQWIGSGSDQSSHQVVNNYPSDSGYSEPSSSSSSSSSEPTPKSSSSASSSTPSQSEAPKTASTPNNENPKSSSSTAPNTTGTPAQAIASSGSGSGSGAGSGAETRSTGPQEQLTRRGIAPVGIENTASHISPYESSDRPSSEGNDTRVSSIPDTARQSSLRNAQDSNKNSVNMSNLDKEGRLDNSQVRYSARKNLGDENSNNYTRSSQNSSKSNISSNDISSTSTSSSQTQNGIQQGQPLQPQNALQGGIANGVANGIANGQLPQEQFAGNGVQSLRRNINPNGVETYDGAKQTGSPLFTSQNADPESLGKIPDKKNNSSNEKKPSVADTAYATAGGANVDYEPKTTVGDAVERAMGEEADPLKDLLGKSNIEEVVAEPEVKKDDEQGLGTLAELAKFLADDEPVNRKIASKVPKKAGAKPPADLTAAKANIGSPAEQPQSFFSKILSLFGV